MCWLFVVERKRLAILSYSYDIYCVYVCCSLYQAVVTS